MLKFANHMAALVVLLLAASPAAATSHMDFQRQQCNSAAADLDAQILGCTTIVESNRFKDAAKSVAYYNMGVAYGLDGQLERAIENYDKAIELDPDNADAAFNRDLAVRALEAKGKKEKIEGEPRGKQEITRRDLPEDMRRNTTGTPVQRNVQEREMQTERNVQERSIAPRTRAERKKVR